MRLLLIGLMALIVSTLLTPPLFAAKHGGKASGDPETLSYSIGVNVGSSMKKQGIDLDSKAFMQGLNDILGDKKLKFSADEMKQALSAFGAAQAAKQQAVKRESGQTNQKKGQKFLAANKKKKGIKTTASGLQYKINRKGKGVSPKASQKVKVHYKGQLLDGTVFDSSYKRGQPATFPVNQVIKGWTEVLQMMKPGGKWEVWIPSGLAYGPRGAGGSIGPHATLHFEIELLAILP